MNTVASLPAKLTDLVRRLRDGDWNMRTPEELAECVADAIMEALATPNPVRADGLIGFSQPGSAIRTVRDLPAEQPEGKGADRMAIRLLVAAGHVTEAKANEALCIAHGFEPGPLAPAAPVGVESDERDARRYRYLRSHYDVSASRRGFYDLLAIRPPQKELPSTGPTMDAFVDAALAGKDGA